MSNLIAENAELRRQLAELQLELGAVQLKLSNAQADAEAARQETHRERVARRIADAARREGAIDIALPDIEHRATQGDWRPNAKGEMVLHENGIAAYDERGNAITEKTWVANLRQTSKHFFEPLDGAQVPAIAQAKPTGTRALTVQTNQPPTVINEENPFDHRSKAFNLTAQGRLVRDDPTKAKALMQAANWAPEKIAEFFGEPRPIRVWY